MNPRIAQCFGNLRDRDRRGFIVYITAGDPSMEDTVDIVLRLAEAGVDLVELGVPFSDPLADGPVNQAAAERALNAGTRLEDVLEGVRAIRARSDIPLVFYSYLNPLLGALPPAADPSDPKTLAAGFDATLARMARAGVDGLLALDLTAEEAPPFLPAFERHGIDRICLVTPTSTDERIAQICRQAGGFVYCVSREGVTGARDAISEGAADLLARTRMHTDLPLALGFGISSPGQVSEAAGMADAVVVGSALVQRFHEAGRDGRHAVIAWAAELAAAAHEASTPRSTR